MKNILPIIALIVVTGLLLVLAGCATGNNIESPVSIYPPKEGPVLASPGIIANSDDEASQVIESYTVPESEMTHITFSLEWILKNDVFQDDPSTVKITFPASWVNNAPPVPESETPVELRVPIRLLDDNNESVNPDEITVVFPNAYFIGMPDLPHTPGIPSPQLIREPPGFNFFTQPGVNPPAEELRISAISGPLDWSLTNDTSWLTISLTNGTASAEKETVTVSANTTGMAAGDYNATITFKREETDWSQDIPVRLFITSAQAGTVLDIPIVADTGSAFVKGIQLGPATVVTNILERAGQNGWRGGYFNAGDPCLLVSGVMQNNTDGDWLVHYYAYGYDAEGNEVSWTLDVDPGPLSGIVNMDISARTSEDFTLHLSWAENINLIKIFANIYPQPK
jgi:hypothetical protein